jgi:hypothetical protein
MVPDEEEEEWLGWETVVKLYRVRDDYLRSQLMSYNCGHSSGETTIESEFGEELRRISSG